MPLMHATQWWSQSGSNRRPPACKAGALPAELWPLTLVSIKFNQCITVELTRFSADPGNHREIAHGKL
jgi:hypothetical protein